MIELGKVQVSPGVSIEFLESILEQQLNGDVSLQLARNFYRATLIRSIEMNVCADPRIISMIRTPGVYRGQERTIIESVLQQWMDDIPDGAIEYFVSLVHSGVAHNQGKENSLDNYFRDILARDFRPGSELRCGSCGYHFEARDMGSARLEVVRVEGLALSKAVPVGRVRDPWKKASDRNRQLTIDHIIPEGALGGARLDNLLIRCNFCNSAKRMTLRYQESYGSRVSAAMLAMVGGDRGEWSYALAVYFSLQMDPYCTYDGCGAQPLVSELTGIPANGDRRWTSLLPEFIVTRCYSHSGLEG